MANVFTKIQRKVNQGDFYILPHCYDALDDDSFLQQDAIGAVLNPDNYFEFTEDDTHVRYCFEGFASDDRMIGVIVFIDQGIVIFKTAYEM